MSQQRKQNKNNSNKQKKKSVKDKSDNPFIDQQIVGPTNMKKFEEVMPQWYKRIMKARSWKKLNQPTTSVDKCGEPIKLDANNYKTGMIGEIYEFEMSYMHESSMYYDVSMKSFDEKLSQMIRIGERLEISEHTTKTDGDLKKTRQVFSEQINECMNYLTEKYPENGGTIMIRQVELQTRQIQGLRQNKNTAIKKIEAELDFLKSSEFEITPRGSSEVTTANIIQGLNEIKEIAIVWDYIQKEKKQS